MAGGTARRSQGFNAAQIRAPGSSRTVSDLHSERAPYKPCIDSCSDPASSGGRPPNIYTSFSVLLTGAVQWWDIWGGQGYQWIQHNKSILWQMKWMKQFTKTPRKNNNEAPRGKVKSPQMRTRGMYRLQRETPPAPFIRNWTPTPRRRGFIQLQV